MKKIFPLLLLLCCLTGCTKSDGTMDCTISWQLYHRPKYLEDSQIEKAFQDTFFAFYDRVNDNTAIARNTTRDDVRSLTLQLANMADDKISGTLDPSRNEQVEVVVIINFAGSYTEEVWSKSYL